MSKEQGDGPRNSGLWGTWIGGLSGLSDGPAGLVYKEWETWFEKNSERLLGNENFLSRLGQAMEMSQGLRTTIKDVVVGMSGGDAGADDEEVEALKQRVQALEFQVSALRARLDELG